MKKKSITIFIILVIAILSIDIYSDLKLKGSDDRAEQAIASINGSYKPWAKRLWQPDSSIKENILFAGQGAIGVGFIIYYITGKKKSAKDNNNSSKEQ